MLKGHDFGFSSVIVSVYNLSIDQSQLSRLWFGAGKQTTNNQNAISAPISYHFVKTLLFISFLKTYLHSYVDKLKVLSQPNSTIPSQVANHTINNDRCM